MKPLYGASFFGMVRINKYLKSLKPSSTLAINERVRDLRNQGESIFHFGFGQSPFPIHLKIIQELQKYAGNNTYLPALGLAELREQISVYLKHYHDVKYNSDLIFLGPGSKELLFQTVMILDHTFLIPQGSWVSYLPQIKAKGGRYHVLNTHYEDNYKIRPKTLEGYCRDHPDEQFVLILNSPNNPTGAVYSETELKALAMSCQKYGAIVLSDEIYSRICFQEESAPSIASYYPQGTILFSGLSKIFSAGGYRCGFMALPDELKSLRPIFRSLFSETFSAVASPVQYAACAAFEIDPDLEKYINANTAVLKAIGNYVYHQLSAHKIQCTEPMGAFYILVDLSSFDAGLKTRGLDTSEAVAMYILNHYKIALLPGSDFYFEPTVPIFRLAFVDFDGSRIPANWMELPQDEFIQQVAPNVMKGVDQLVRFCTELTNEMPLKAE